MEGESLAPKSLVTPEGKTLRSRLGLTRLLKGIVGSRTPADLLTQYNTAIAKLSTQQDGVSDQQDTQSINVILKVTRSNPESDDVQKNFVSSMSAIVKTGNTQAVSEVFNIVKKALTEPSTLHDHAVAAVPSFLRSSDQPIRSEARALLENILQTYKLDPQKTIQAWEDSAEESSVTQVLTKNLKAIIQLENDRPNICQVLNREFNIYDFARYPLPLLINQYEQLENPNFPYGLVIYPRYDHDGAYYQDMKMFEELMVSLEGKYALKVFEVGNIREFIHVLNKSRHRYGKVSFSIIGGHGEKSSIQFGKNDFDNLYSQDLILAGARAAKQAFHENPSLVLLSCSAGDIGGIGQYISKVGGDVIAPETDIKVSTIHATFDETGKVHFTAFDSKGNSFKRYTYGKAAKLS